MKVESEDSGLVLEISDPTRDEMLSCFKSCCPPVQTETQPLVIRGFVVPGLVTKVEFKSGVQHTSQGMPVRSSARIHFNVANGSESDYAAVVCIKKAWAFKDGDRLRQVKGSNCESIGYPKDMLLSTRFVSENGRTFYYAWIPGVKSYQLLDTSEIERDYVLVD